jgi:hypothetical protein
MLNALRRGPAAAACLLATVGLVATGLVVLPVSRGVASTSASAGPTRLTVSPAVGGPTSIVSVHFIADYTATVYGGDELAVIGPANTRCAGDLIGDGGVNGPNADGSGPVTLYIGPRVEVEYPQLAGGNVYDPIFGSKAAPLTRWCPGVYAGQIWNPDVYQPSLKATFQFRISATKRTKLATTVARHLRSVTVTPGTGVRSTIFAVHYRADSDPSVNGDVVQVIGPGRASCAGTVVRRGAARLNRRAGQLTLHIGPGATRNHSWYEQGAAYVPASNDGTGRPVRNWCAGSYTGTIFYEHGPRFTVIARFKLTVAK